MERERCSHLSHSSFALDSSQTTRASTQHFNESWQAEACSLTAEETHRRACNRVQQAATLVPDADMAIAIESGLFEEYPEGFFDRAIVVVRLPDGQVFTQMSEGVLMPTDAVEEVRRRGAASWTIGKILQERGCVQSHTDPHLSLVGRSRTAFIKDALVLLLAQGQQGSV